MKTPPKLFVVRQYIWAKDAPSALREAKKHNADECWIDEDYRKRMSEPKNAVGFQTEDNEIIK